MMKSKIFLYLAIVMMLVGCSTNTGPEYDGRSYKQIKTIEMGRVVRTEKIVISDSGTGKSAGTMIGGIAGSAAGYNNGSFLASMGGAILGGLVGGAVGSEAGKSDGAELTVDLDDGRRIVIVVEQDNIEAGDRIEIIKNGNQVEKVNRVVD